MVTLCCSNTVVYRLLSCTSITVSALVLTHPRSNWLVGLGILFFILLSGFTGYLLPWDQLALWAVTVGTNMMGFTPVFGQEVRFVLLGGAEIGSETLLRWYVLHVVFLPFILTLFMAVHFWRVRKDGGISGPL